MLAIGDFQQEITLKLSSITLATNPTPASLITMKSRAPD